MIDRRTLLTGLSATGLSLAGLGATARSLRAQEAAPGTVPEEFMPRMIRITGAVQPYEIHVDPDAFALYWTLPEGRAIRYAVGIGREGLYESGVFYVGAKKEWPAWTPTPEMIARDPASYERWKDGMPGGPNNPLGARALYLFTMDGGDSFLRIHGTNAPGTIGTRVSNGCARLINSHMVHLYDQVPIGARVYLRPPGGATESG